MIPPGTATASPRPRSWRRDADEAARRLRAATIDGPQPAASILAARLRADLGELRYRDVVRRAGLELQLALPYAGTGAELMGVEEEHCVREVLRARRLWRYELPTRTSFVARFERDAEILLGVRHVHATVSGSVALQIALLALGVGPGDEVLIPAVTWVGCADAVILCGAVPVPCEVDATLGLSAAAVERRITERTKVVMAASLYGNPCDLVRLGAVAHRHGIALLEDDCQAAGVSLGRRRLGGFGEAAVFSTNFMKFVAAGDGGFIATDRDDLYAFAVAYTGGKVFPRGKRELGLAAPRIPCTALRMSELTGAVAHVQLRRLDDLLARMRSARDEVFAGVGGARTFARIPTHDAAGDAGWCTPLLFADEHACQAFASALRGRGVRHVTTARERFAGAEIEHCYAAMADEQLIGRGGGHWASEFDAMVGRRSLDPRMSPWTDPRYEGNIDYPAGFDDHSLDLVRRIAFIQTNPRLEARHCRLIAAAIRDADAELAEGYATDAAAKRFALSNTSSGS